MATNLTVDQLNALQSRAWIFGMDILGIGAAFNYLATLTTRNERYIYSTTSASLLTSNSDGFIRMNSFASTGIENKVI
jgi:hypothetical protein